MRNTPTITFEQWEPYANGAQVSGGNLPAEYYVGIDPPNYPVPATFYTEELINFKDDELSFVVCYRKPNNRLHVIGF